MGGTSGVPAVEVRQLGTEDGSLNALHTRVEADLDVLMPCLLGMVAQPPNAAGDSVVIRADSAAFAKSAEVLAREEPEAAGLAERTTPPAADPGPLGLGAVLDQP